MALVGMLVFGGLGAMGWGAVYKQTSLVRLGLGLGLVGFALALTPIVAVLILDLYERWRR